MRNLFTVSIMIICTALSAQETCEDLDGSSFMDVLVAEVTGDQSYNNQRYPSLKLFVETLDNLINPDIVYDPTYRKLDNLCDDVPADVGVCSDVVIRAFHNIDICLAEYVRAHRLSKGLPIDRHIDHRRVRNLGALFTADGLEIPVNQSRYVAD